MKSLEVEGFSIEYRVEFSKRSSIKFEIHYPGFLIVKAPKGSGLEDIESLIKKNSKAILDKLQSYKDFAAPKEMKSFKDGESFSYLGIPYQLKINVSPDIHKNSVAIENSHMLVFVKSEDSHSVMMTLEKFYKKECKKIVAKRISYYQKNFRNKPKAVEIIDSHERWGSCNYLKILSFNWRLAMAPLHVIDYIVVHEMSHMEHMNHSKSFWTSVGKIMPHYKKDIEWLALSSHKLLNLNMG